MQSGVIRGQIRNEFITQHSTLSNHRPERMLAHPARFLLGFPHGSHGSHGFFFVASNGDSHLVSLWKNSEGVKIREIREIRVGKIQHLTFKINHHESKLEIRHQFRHHCPHCRPQLLLRAELRQPLSRTRISRIPRIFTSLGDEYLLPCHQH